MSVQILSLILLLFVMVDAYVLTIVDKTEAASAFLRKTKYLAEITLLKNSPYQWTTL